MSNAGTYEAVATLDNRRFLAGMQGMQSGLQGLVGKVAAFAAAWMGVRAISQGLMGAVEEGAKLNDLSVQTGIAVDRLVVLRSTFEDLGLGGENVASVVGNLRNVLAGLTDRTKVPRDFIKQLGLDPDQLAGLEIEDALRRIAEAMGRVTDQNDRNRASEMIFGANLEALFQAPGAIAEIRGQLGTLPQLMADNARRFDQLQDTIARIKYKFMGFWAGIMEGLAPTIQKISDAFDKIDFAEIGKSIGHTIRMIIEIIKTGWLGQYLTAQLTYAALTFVDYLVRGVQMVIILLTQMAGTLLDNFGRKLRGLDPKEPSPDSAAALGRKWDRTIDMNLRYTSGKTLDYMYEEAAKSLKRQDEAAKQEEAAAAAKKERGPGIDLKMPDFHKDGGYKQITDQFAAIGLYMGGNGPGTADYARRTATATEKALQHLEDIRNKLKQSPVKPTAAWGT